MKKAIGILMNPDNTTPMTIYFNGAGECMTAENATKVEEVEYTAESEADARQAAKAMWGAWPWEYIEYTYDIEYNGLHLNFTEDQQWEDDNTFTVIAHDGNGKEYAVSYAAADNLTGDADSPDFVWENPAAVDEI